MGVFDKAANYAYRAEPLGVTRRVLRLAKLPFRYRSLFETRTTPLPAEKDRTADKVAVLEDPADPNQPWLLVFEWQAQHDEDKLDVTLLEAARLRADHRHGTEAKGKYKVLVALVYMTGVCPAGEVNMLAGEEQIVGTLHRPLIWNIGNDSAIDLLAEVDAEPTSWGLLFWIPLSQGGGESASIQQTLTFAQRVESSRNRADLGKVLLVMADLAGNEPQWRKALEAWNMKESRVVLEWTQEAEREGELKAKRTALLQVMDVRFPGSLSEEERNLIATQDSLEMLDDWFKTALTAFNSAAFRAILRQ